jgi:hypothetical protein
MADIPSLNSKIQVEETTYRAPVSETLTQRMGGSINYALDQVSSTSGALAAETAARIAADSTINGKLVVRSVNESGTTMTFNSGSIYADGALIAEDTFAFSNPNTASTWILLDISADASNVIAPRLPSYLEVALLSHDSYGSQTLTTFTSVGGQQFGTVVWGLNYGSTITVRVRQYASASIPGSGTRWTWGLDLRYATLNSAAVFGS